MTENLLLDTDVLIDFLRGYPDAVKYVKEHTNRIVISAISIAELYAGVKGNKEMEKLKSFLALFPVLEVSENIAKTAGLYKNQYSKSHNTGLADALIAATVDFHDANLITLNSKHFPMFSDLETPYRKK
ncbi:MAG: type II toxin-antitoxin system VapC family toxin [bacterium]|nr:type II toxin-antitoxin system VapC family toxin [bacterium]